jgi:hypothetical protein
MLSVQNSLENRSGIKTFTTKTTVWKGINIVFEDTES